MNNNFRDEKKLQIKKVFSILSVIAFLTCCFLLSYMITDRLTNPKYQKSNLQESEEKVVYNATDKLEDEVSVVLMTANEITKEQSLEEFKKDNNIQVDVTEQFLINFLEASGYKLEALDDKKIVFKKDSAESTLVPDKYYLGEKDGYFAIYKTDSDGRPFIESESDVFKEHKKVNTIPVSAEEDIKNFKYYYDTKDEALQRIGGYMN